ncbi:MAG: RNB domain-containing ribonuclease [Desulfovibrionaceae bacterium]|nr:RNB domain-containing ribonuclease [Desulfovibrionaceae bacterium]
MAEKVLYPITGCIVEYMEGNVVQTAMVVGAAGERLRLLLPNRREVNLMQNRLLPWLGPVYTAKLSRDESIRLLEEHRKNRLELSQNIDIIDVWELAQGEVEQASCQWVAELLETDPSYDAIAAYARAMLQCKTHFRFQPPVFQIYNAEIVEKRIAEQKRREEREELSAKGRAFVALLWDVSLGRRTLPPKSGNGLTSEWPSEPICQKIEEVLRRRMLDPDDLATEGLWLDLSPGIPDVPQIPIDLLIAWGKLPAHYNVWLAQTDFEADDEWWQGYADEVAELQEAKKSDLLANLPTFTQEFVSIDSIETKDVDDAFTIEEIDSGWRLTLALAAPAIAWNFGGPFDLKVRSRATSLYLPEKTSHMLPECLGIDAYSLLANEDRLAFVVQMDIAHDGTLTSCEPKFGWVKLAANLRYLDCEEVLTKDASLWRQDNPAAPYAKVLNLALQMANARQDKRLETGAVIMNRPDPHIRLEGTGSETKVFLDNSENAPLAQFLVAEAMISASIAVADYGAAHNIPLLHRTQDVEVAAENKGLWTNAADIYRAMRSLVASILEVNAARHAGLGVDNYAPCTSPLRRYGDLVNEAQIASFLLTGKPKFNHEELEEVCANLSLALSSVMPVQRQRPRYWKLVYFKQQGDKVWWDGVICDDGESYLTISLVEESFYVRARRQLFDDWAAPGIHVKVRIGKVQPYWNDIQVLEVMIAE